MTAAHADDRSSERLLRWIATLAIFLVGLLPPSLFVLAKYNEITKQVAQDAAIQATLIERYASLHPDSWRYKSEHIEVSLHGIRHDDAHTLVESDGQPLFTIGVPIEGALITRSSDFSGFGQIIGRAVVTHSAQQVIDALWLALALGVGVTSLLLWLLHRFVLERLRIAQTTRRITIERMQDLVDMSSDWFWEQDAEYRFIVNSLDKLGVITSELLGKHHWDLPIKLSAEQWAAHRSELDAHRRFTLRYAIDTPTGERRFEINGKPIYGAQGQCTGYRGVGRDITREIEREAELVRHRNHLEDLVTQRTAALKQAKESAESARSLVEATLEASDNGVLVVNIEGQITQVNKRFGVMWGIPPALIDAGDDQVVLAYVTQQLLDPQMFLEKVLLLYSKPDATSRDTLYLSDGRVFARFSHPQRMGQQNVGRVWIFQSSTTLSNVCCNFRTPSPPSWKIRSVSVSSSRRC